MSDDEAGPPKEAWGPLSVDSKPIKSEKHPGKGSSEDPAVGKTKSRRDRIVVFLENQLFQAIVGAFTVFSLYGDDIRAGYFFKNSDFYFYISFFACLLIFAWELTMQCIVIEGYKGSFFFWLDVVATGSLILDIPWLTDGMVALYSTGAGGGGNEIYGDILARAGRAARVGTRAGRIVRLVKLMQVFSAINPEEWCASKARREEIRRLKEEAKAKAKSRVQASQLGKILAEQTTRRVIVAVLMMMIILPFLQTEETDLGPLFGLSLLFLNRSPCATVQDYGQLSLGAKNCTRDGYEPDVPISREAWEFLVFQYAQQSKIVEHDNTIFKPLLFLQAPDYRKNGEIAYIENVKTRRCRKVQNVYPFLLPAENGLPEDECEEGHCCWNSLPACAGWGSEVSADCPWREAELEMVEWEPPTCKPEDSPCFGLRLRAKFLMRNFKEVEAGRACVRTSFIIMILAFASVFFSQDTQNLVVAPIEKMVNIVKQLADDPLRKPELPDDDEEMSMEGQTKKKPTGQLETTMLETTILKIGGLLRIGFGEAGASIIGKNMESTSADERLNIMLPGLAVEAVYGFVGISDFAELTECLLEEVMVFVNKVARIVHTSTNEWYGAANKNMGDSFFLIWTLPSPELMAKLSSQRETLASTDELEIPAAEYDMSFPADSALFASVKIVAEIRRATDLMAYGKHPKIVPKFGISYRVSVTIGVHVGWSIEGAIGSEHKIDASYLSPHVNLCAALERIARRIYQTEIIVSQHLAELLSARANERCRLIDCAKIMSSIDVLEIYTFDIHKEVVTMAPDQHQLGGVIAPPEMSQAELTAKGFDGYWDFDQDVVMLQTDVTATFRASWEQAYRLYIEGDWQVAAEVLNKISTNFPLFDGPTQAILQYMLNYELMPPDDWSDFVRSVCQSELSEARQHIY